MTTALSDIGSAVRDLYQYPENWSDYGPTKSSPSGIKVALARAGEVWVIKKCKGPTKEKELESKLLFN